MRPPVIEGIEKTPPPTQESAPRLPLFESFLMRRILSLCAGLLIALSALPAQAANGLFHVLCYHDISAKPQDSFAVTPTQLREHLGWLHQHGYRFISVDDILADRAGKRPLPDKAVLLSFDDGYESMYRQAFPILKEFKAPAVIGLIGSWLTPGQHTHADHAAETGQYLTWAQLREMQASGLVEIASHTFDLHHGIPANPQGSQMPAASTRQYSQGQYESEAHYRQRITHDLATNNALIRRELGTAPRVMVWPYGSYNRVTQQIAGKLGMPLTLTLDDGPNRHNVPLAATRRLLIDNSTNVSQLQNELALRERATQPSLRPGKIMHVDLDYLYDTDPKQRSRNLDLLMDRIRAMKVNTVYLQAFSDPDGNGAADQAYFPNRHLPVRADLFSYVAWTIKTRSQVKAVYAWMPMLAFELPQKHPAARDVVVTLPHPQTGHVAMGYPRLSPFSARARQAIREIYQDLGRHAQFDGILFHDDVTLSDYEDASPAALKQYRAWGLPADVNKIRASEKLQDLWTANKTRALDRFAMELAGILKQDHPALATARNLYASVALNPRSEVWYAQSLENSLATYDYTAIMAMPYMENAQDPARFMRNIFEKVASQPGALDKTVFELQAVDWRNDQAVSSQEMADTIQNLYRWGARHVGYYPDKLYQAHPDTDTLRGAFSHAPATPPTVR